MDYVARLSYLNKDYLLFFRGQWRDYKNKAGASTFYPSIYRGDRVSKSEIGLKFDVLTSSSKRLCNSLEARNIEGYKDVKRRKYIQWSILQHYEVCPTPLLDLTHSLRVACSFAFLSSEKRNPYVFVFGLPYITNRISINSEHDIVTIRLLSISPPDALRPYYQEGYLSGTEDITYEYDSKDEMDFNRRLIAKFCLIPKSKFWEKGFDQIPKKALYPSGDKIEEICNQIKTDVGTDFEPGRLGQFLQQWTNLESLIFSLARRRRKNIFSIMEALNVLSKAEILPVEIRSKLDKVRKLRNLASHQPERLTLNELSEGFREISILKWQLAKIDNL
jgi:hypothetical protein